jgi:5'-3' exonuclease
MTEITAIIDADSIAWIIGYRHKDNQLEGMVIDDVDTFVKSVLNNTGATHYVGYLGNDTKTSFRRDMVPGYKSNRPDTPDWYKQWGKIIDSHLIQAWGFQRSADGFEADDMIAAAAQACVKDYEICGVDKDLKQIPGKHYNYNKNEHVVVSQREGEFSLAIQCLTGDSTDGIKGIPKVGPKTAITILAETPDSMSLLIPCLNKYLAVYGEAEGVKQFYQNYMQVKLHADIPEFALSRMNADAFKPVPSAPVEKPIVQLAVTDGADYDIDNLFKVAS